MKDKNVLSGTKIFNIQMKSFTNEWIAEIKNREEARNSGYNSGI